jgi:hypothetical protein
MSGIDNETINVMKEAINELKESNQYHGIGLNFRKEFENLQSKITDNIENNCSKEYNELKNSRDPRNERNYRRKYEEFQICAAKNDFGVTNLMKEMMRKQEQQNSDDHSCIVACKFDNLDKIKKKDCLKKCLLKSEENFAIINESIKMKINQIQTESKI